MLKMSNMHLGMSGIYKVVTKAEFCEFTKEITVDVYGEFFSRFFCIDRALVMGGGNRVPPPA